MLKPDYLDLDKDGNKKEPMKEAVKDRDMKAMGGLLKDERENYVIGGIAKILSSSVIKNLKKLKAKAKDVTEDGTQKNPKEAMEFQDESIRVYEELIDAGIPEDKAVKELQSALGIKLPDLDNPPISRIDKAEGGSMDDQMLMVMTPPIESEMESDDDMEDGYTRFIMEEALSEEEEDMLTSKLEQDEELSMLFDKIIDVAQEFAGSGPVEGPGSGVSDSIPARLSDGEFVFTAKAVEEIGEDSLMSMMKDAEAKADERQGFAEGNVVEEDNVEMVVEKQPTQQNIRVTKETVGPRAGMLEQNDLVDDEVKKSMFRQNRFLG